MIKAHRLFKIFVDLQGGAIHEKVRIIAANFHQKLALEIHGTARP